MSIKQETIENVIERLEEKYEGFSSDMLEDSPHISEFNDVNSVYFSGEFTNDGLNIKMGDIILFAESEDKDCKCIHPDNEQPEGEAYDCRLCDGCQDYTEDDIFSICLARLRGLKDILLLGDGEKGIR